MTANKTEWNICFKCRQSQKDRSTQAKPASNCTAYITVLAEQEFNNSEPFKNQKPNILYHLKGSHPVATLSNKGCFTGQAVRNVGFFFYWQEVAWLQLSSNLFLPVIPLNGG